MTVRVRLFANLREAAGTAECEVETGSAGDVGRLLDLLCADYPMLMPHRNYLRVAVNRVYARPETLLHEGDEVALIPPTSGG
ncbi:MAG TPA: molybdopterin converting factor subunit 1 [Bacteroidota bacterium]|nr:molybdopterin converting factor subunit 1 [Bacteroidota bacterium]